ncbi:putative cucumisin [Helianthus anomalus]
MFFRLNLILKRFRESFIIFFNSSTYSLPLLLISKTTENSMAGDVYIFTGANDNYDVSLSFNYTQRFLHDLIKPDVIAPGVEILAAFSPIATTSEVSWDKNTAKFSILPGPSVACPHVAAATAFVKSFHPK